MVGNFSEKMFAYRSSTTSIEQLLIALDSFVLPIATHLLSLITILPKPLISISVRLAEMVATSLLSCLKTSWSCLMGSMGPKDSSISGTPCRNDQVSQLSLRYYIISPLTSWFMKACMERVEHLVNSGS